MPFLAGEGKRKGNHHLLWLLLFFFGGNPFDRIWDPSLKASKRSAVTGTLGASCTVEQGQAGFCAMVSMQWVPKTGGKMMMVLL